MKFYSVFSRSDRMLPIRSNFVWTFAFLIPLLVACTVQSDVPTVKIKNGTLEGLYMKSRYEREFVAFRGIPYAVPPLGQLRFEPPKPVSSWNGVLKAQDDASICIQRNIYIHEVDIVGSEDCLYLNVYTPKLPSTKNENSATTYPVMIWFHGGGWVAGAGHSQFYGPKFLLDHDLVLVTVNYRLGPIGFLSTEDMVLPGNLGMKDQVQAMRWVQENIAAFGGDPNSVTIFGESAGGASGHYHMISSLSKGLFHRTISQSGHVYCPWAFRKPGLSKKLGQTLAELLNCPTEDSKLLRDCLRTKDAIDIVATDRHFQVFDYSPMITFRIVIEPDHPGAFITEDPVTSARSGKIADVPWMTGITSQEGTLKVAAIGASHKKLMKRLNDDFENIILMSLSYENSCPKKFHKEVIKKIREFYFGDKPIDNSTRWDVIDMYSDGWFSYPAHLSMNDFFNLQSSPIYNYYFSYRGSASLSKVFGDPDQDYGVSHGDDLQYLFPVGEQMFPETPLSKEDHKMIDIMTNLWYNFAKSGNPTPELTPIITTKWKSVKTKALEYYHIGQSELTMADNLYPKRLAFWKSLPIKFGDEKISEAKDEL